jgi:hypothetical protein
MIRKHFILIFIFLQKYDSLSVHAKKHCVQSMDILKKILLKIRKIKNFNNDRRIILFILICHLIYIVLQKNENSKINPHHAITNFISHPFIR